MGDEGGGGEGAAVSSWAGACFAQIMRRTEGQAASSERTRNDAPGFIDRGAGAHRSPAA